MLEQTKISRMPGGQAKNVKEKSGFFQRHPHIFVHLALGLGGFVTVFPFVWQLIMSLSTQAEVTSVPPTLWPADLQWGNYSTVFDQMPFLDQFFVSMMVTIITVVGQVIFCAMAGYAFARMKFWGQGVLLAVILSILMVPSQVYLIPQYAIIQDLGGLNTIWGIAAPGIFSAFGTFLMRQAFLALPLELEEAARLDGANPLQMFWKVLLPLTKPSLSALTIITVLYAWNNLLWPLVITTNEVDMPLAVGLASLQGQHATDYPVLMAASLMAMAPVLIMFIVLQRRVVDGLAHSGLK